MEIAGSGESGALFRVPSQGRGDAQCLHLMAASRDADQHSAATPGCQELCSLLQELDTSRRMAACFGYPAAVGLAERAPSPSPRSRGSVSPFSPYFS